MPNARPVTKPTAPAPEPEQTEDVAVARMSPSLNHFAPAFVRFQADLQPVTKNANNPHFGNDFADLAAILDEALPLLNDNGFALMQFPSGENGKLGLLSMLIHESGQFVSATMPLVPVKNDPQGEGSAITYGRRYAACAILGIRTVDDDGIAGSGGSVRRIEPRQERKRQAEPEQTDPEDWFRSNGWKGKLHHDEIRAELSAAVAALPESVRTTFRRWYDDQSHPWKAPWPEAFAALVGRKVTEFAALPSQDDEKAPSTPGEPDTPTEAPAPTPAECAWCTKPGELLTPLVNFLDAPGPMHADCHPEFVSDNSA